MQCTSIISQSESQKGTRIAMMDWYLRRAKSYIVGDVMSTVDCLLRHMRLGLSRVGWKILPK